MRDKWSGFVVAMLAILPPAAASAQSQQYPTSPACSSWIRFQPGAWKTVRITRHAYDSDGSVLSKSVRETKTTLAAVDQTGFVLKVETTVNVPGQQLETQPQTIRLGWHGELQGETADVRPLGSSVVRIGHQVIPSRVQEVWVNGVQGRRLIRVHLSKDETPQVLKREIIATTGVRSQSKTTVEVTELGKEQKVLSDVKTTSIVRAKHESPTRRAEVVETHCGDVPGGVIAHESIIKNKDGQIVEESTLELVGFSGTALPGSRFRGFLNRLRRN